MSIALCRSPNPGATSSSRRISTAMSGELPQPLRRRDELIRFITQGIGYLARAEGDPSVWLPRQEPANYVWLRAPWGARCPASVPAPATTLWKRVWRAHEFQLLGVVRYLPEVFRLGTEVLEVGRASDARDFARLAFFVDFDLDRR